MYILYIPQSSFTSRKLERTFKTKKRFKFRYKTNLFVRHPHYYLTFIRHCASSRFDLLLGIPGEVSPLYLSLSPNFRLFGCLSLYSV
uniref:Uncharacterized protein n=1 Tax=Meloidogyne enterolobii TaxID=390850 RepID=A0A6V7UHD5_MELEN|nr:unnamed protein product [Meloidogyne enterolobii]